MMAKSKKNTPKPFIIDDETINDPVVRDLVYSPVVDGEAKGHGLVPRDYSVYPKEMFDPPSLMKLIPRSEWSDRIKMLEREQATIRHILERGDGGKEIPPTDQNGHGYCWAYSTGGAVQVVRALQGQPYVALNPHAVAAIIKRGRDEGGWCGLSAKFLRETGIPSFEFWPRHSRDLSNDTPVMRANAALHKVTEEWVDLTRDVYDQNLADDVICTCLLSNIPVAADFNHWSHSVTLTGLKEVEPGSFGKELRNSWGRWGDNGYAIFRGSKAIVNGAVALRVAGASPI